jgi:hypothetical protein
VSGNSGRTYELIECEMLLRTGSPAYPRKRAISLARSLLQQGYPMPDRKKWPLTVELMKKVKRREKLS